MCAVSILIFSLGPLKETYYYSIVPRFVHPGYASPAMELHTAVYSAITWIVYAFGVAALLIFACYFSRLDRRKPRLFRVMSVLTFIPAVVLTLLYPPAKTHSFQLADRSFWYLYSLYNIGYGAWLTALMLGSVRRETQTAARRQKLLISLSILPPAWFALYAIFIVHSLRFSTYFKLWQVNAAFIGLSVFFFIWTAFKEGMMGLRLKMETFKWDSDMRMMSKGAQYTGHMVKNETVKIEWCLERLKERNQDRFQEELDDICRSVAHLQHFVHKSQRYSEDIVLQEEELPLEEIIGQSIDHVRRELGEAVQFAVEGAEGIRVTGDRHHLAEMLGNLLANAIEAMGGQGTICVRCSLLKGGRRVLLSVEDAGCGIPKEHLPRVFEPYFTTKHTGSHFGLGLGYCASVVRKHGGAIALDSREGQGTAVRVELPAKRRSPLSRRSPPQDSAHEALLPDIGQG